MNTKLKLGLLLGFGFTANSFGGPSKPLPEDGDLYQFEVPFIAIGAPLASNAPKVTVMVNKGVTFDEIIKDVLSQQRLDESTSSKYQVLIGVKMRGGQWKRGVELQQQLTDQQLDNLNDGYFEMSIMPSFGGM